MDDEEQKYLIISAVFITTVLIISSAVAFLLGVLSPPLLQSAYGTLENPTHGTIHITKKIDIYNESVYEVVLQTKFYWSRKYAFPASFRAFMNLNDNSTHLCGARLVHSSSDDYYDIICRATSKERVSKITLELYADNASLGTAVLLKGNDVGS
jgi:hypothetical protein